MDSGFKIVQDCSRLLVLPGAARAAFCEALTESSWVQDCSRLFKMGKTGLTWLPGPGAVFREKKYFPPTPASDTGSTQRQAR